MTLRFAYTRPDGGLSIVNAAPKESLERVLGPLTDAAYRAHVLERSIPANATNVQELSEDWSPPDIDRTFRDAWRQGQDKVHVDMPLARDVWREHLRRLRAPRLRALDVEYQRADENNDAQHKRDIALQKQALRDVTADPAVEAAQTPEELRLVIPSVLLDGGT